MATLAEKALAVVLGIETIAGKGPTGRAGRAALKAGAKAIIAGAPVAGRVATGTVLPTAGRLAAANPVSTGLGLGLGFTHTPTGQALLESAAERGAADRVRAQQMYDEFVFRNLVREPQMVADIVKSSLGPRGLDKMLVDSLGDVTITNDGATILKEIDAQHPAAKMMIEISKTIDTEVGDGTTSSVIFAGTLLAKAEELLKKDVHSSVIIEGFQAASEKALEVLAEISKKVKKST